MLSGKSRLLLIFALTEAALLYFCQNHDLQARWFGLCVGLAVAITVWVPARFCVQKTKRKGLLATIAVANLLAGFLVGQILDAVYFVVFSEFPQRFMLLLFLFQSFLLFTLWRVALFSHPMRPAQSLLSSESLPATQTPSSTPEKLMSSRRRVVLAGALVSGTLTFFMAAPNFILRKREPPEGIYLYANDVACLAPVANILSVRLNLLTHTGLCLLTKDPQKINRLRRESGKPTLQFEKLDDGYWIRDLNLNLENYDGFVNYGSATNLDHRSFPFDLDGWKRYLAGRSTNDRLRPAIRIRPLVVQNPIQAWDRVEDFREKINARYPLGFIYSPIPYQGHFVRFFNCNSLVVGVADCILDCGKDAEKMTGSPFQLGGQTIEDGNRLMDDYDSPDFAENLAREREFMETQPLSKQKWIHILLNRAPQNRGR